MNKQQSIKGMFITDFDGTLLSSGKTVSDRDISSLEQLGKQGYIRVIATGRSLYSFMRASPDPLPIDYIIFSTGAGIAAYPDPISNIIKSSSLDADSTRSVAELFNHMNLDYMIHQPIPENHRFLYRGNGSHNADFNSRINFYNGFAERLGANENLSRPSAQMLAVIPPGKDGKPDTNIIESISLALPNLSVIRATSPIDGISAWVEVFSPDSSKSQAVSWLAQRLGVPQSLTMAAGNDYNDADLLSWAGRGFVVKNAPEDLKSRFEQVASNDNDGVTEAVNIMLNLTSPAGSN